MSNYAVGTRIGGLRSCRSTAAPPEPSAHHWPLRVLCRDHSAIALRISLTEENFHGENSGRDSRRETDGMGRGHDFRTTWGWHQRNHGGAATAEGAHSFHSGSS